MGDRYYIYRSDGGRHYLAENWQGTYMWSLSYWSVVEFPSYLDAMMAIRSLNLPPDKLKHVTIKVARVQ